MKYQISGEVATAIETLKGFCSNYADCEDCPFNDGDDCSLGCIPAEYPELSTTKTMYFVEK